MPDEKETGGHKSTIRDEFIAIMWPAFAILVLLGLVILLWSPTKSPAQPVTQPSQVQTYTAFTLAARAADISATTTSGSSLSTIATPGPVAYVCNVGTVFAYVALGIVGLTVTAANGIPVPPNACARLNAIGATRAAAITASGTATVQIATGTGSP